MPADPGFRVFSARSMDLTWLGHACFRMRGREGVVLADPPDPKSGHAISKTEAAIVTISHEHPGHSSLKSVGGEPVVLRGPGEYEVHEVLVTGKTCLDDVLVGVGQRSLRHSGQEIGSLGLPARPSRCFAYSRPAPWT